MRLMVVFFLTNISFIQNSASQHGGAMYLANGYTLLTNGQFACNSASGGGNAIYCVNSTIEVDGSNTNNCALPPPFDLISSTSSSTFSTCSSCFIKDLTCNSNNPNCHGISCIGYSLQAHYVILVLLILLHMLM